jgi:hypothetical protein
MGVARSLIFVAAALSACRGNPSSISVARSEYGEAWPFTIESGTLECQKNGLQEIVTLKTATGVTYALNGSAKSAGFPDSASILKPGKEGGDVVRFISKGLKLCR